MKLNEEEFNKLPKEVQDVLKGIFNKLQELHGIPPDFLDKLKERKEMVVKRIKDNHDPRPKGVGDRVIIWDASFAQIVEGDKIDAKDYVNSPCIVAQEKQSTQPEEEQEILEQAKAMGEDLTLDLVIWCPKIQKHIRTMSRCVKLV